MRITEHTTLSRQIIVRSCSTLLPLLLCPPNAFSAEDGSLSNLVRRAVVRSAQIADLADSAWQQVSGEVVPAWQRAQDLPAQAIPPSLLDASFASELLALPLNVAGDCCGVQPSTLVAQLPSARRNAVLLYKDDPAATTSLDAPVARGTAVRGFPVALSTAVERGEAVENATLFGFEMFVRWRVLQGALSDSREPAERRRLQQCFSERLGAALLRGPLAGAVLPVPHASRARLPRGEQSLQVAIEGCGALLTLMQKKGLFSRYVLQLGLGSGTDVFDEADWQMGGSTSWQYIVSGSSLVGVSQLAQDRTAATGLGAGLYPGQLITAALAAYLRELGVAARIDEYFLDNRVGRPDPRTFSDPRYYSDVLLEVVALEEP